MTPSRRPISPLEWAGVAAMIAVAAFLRFWQPDLGYLSLHTSRDLYRSLELVRGVHFPLLGSEVLYGGRVFGPVMYLLCAIPLSLTMSPVGLPVFIAVVNTLLLAAVWLFVRSCFGPGPAFWTLALYAVFPLEISQLRFNWNPCFLPLFVTGALIALTQVAVRRRPWHVVTLVVFLVLGLQLHLSAAELILSAGVVLLAARVRIPWRAWVVAAGAGILLFTPLLIHEVTAKSSDLAQVVKSPDTNRPWSERVRFNPNGIGNFLYHIRMQMNENGEAVGFAHLQIVPLIGERWLGAGWMTVARVINAFAQIQIVFWLAGVWVCVRGLRKTASGSALAGSEEDDSTQQDENSSASPPPDVPDALDTPARRILFLTLLVWQAIPVAVLSFFNYHGAPGDPPTTISLRYYLVTYPAPYITSALGVVALGRAALAWRNRRGARALRGVVYAVAAALVVSQATFDVLYLNVLDRSGRMIPYQWPNLAPNMRSMMKIRDILLGNARLNRDAWYTRVHAQRLGTWYFGEATFDYLITQDPRSVTNPPPDPHLRWLLFSPFKESTQPELPEGATETRRWSLGNTGMMIVEYRVENPGAAVPDNKEMRNYYYADRRMAYLGPEPELRKEGGDR